MLQREHSAILSTFIKLPFVIKIFVLSIFDWPFYTGFTVHYNYKGIKKGTSAASEPLNSFIIDIYDLRPTYLLFHDCNFGNGCIDHFMDLLNDLHNRYYKY